MVLNNLIQTFLERMKNKLKGEDPGVLMVFLSHEIPWINRFQNCFCIVTWIVIHFIKLFSIWHGINVKIFSEFLSLAAI